MYNGGEEAYKPEEWGNEIIFEKTIYEKSGHLLIKGASGKEVRNTQDLKDRYSVFHVLHMLSQVRCGKGRGLKNIDFLDVTFDLTS